MILLEKTNRYKNQLFKIQIQGLVYFKSQKIWDFLNLAKTNTFVFLGGFGITIIL